MSKQVDPEAAHQDSPQGAKINTTEADKEHTPEGPPDSPHGATKKAASSQATKKATLKANQEAALKTNQKDASQAAPKDASQATQQDDTKWSIVKIALVVVIIISMLVVVTEAFLVYFKVQFYYDAMSKYLKKSFIFKGKWDRFWTSCILSFAFGILEISATIFEWYSVVIVFTIYSWFSIFRSIIILANGHALFWSSISLAVPLAILGLLYIRELIGKRAKNPKGSQVLPSAKQQDPEKAASSAPA